MTQVCTATGLAFVDGPVQGYRIAKSSYGPLTPLPRTVGSADRSSWSRFDTPGSTVYLAGDKRTAYAEALAMARVAKDFHHAIAFTAEQFGISLEDARRMIQDDWARNGNMVPGWLPANWRDGHLMYRLQVDGPTRWIDLTAAESIAALNRHLGQQLEDACGLADITLATLAGEDREPTTRIAEWLREQVLDDGNYAAGVRAHSKYGGACAGRTGCAVGTTTSAPTRSAFWTRLKSTVLTRIWTMFWRCTVWSAAEALMRIAKTDIIAGLPAPAARDFLRRVRLADFHEEWALSLLISPGFADPRSALARFEEDGYIERADHSPEGHRWWRTTTLGNALAMASFGKPISRKAADRLVAEMLNRARTYNADTGKPCYVERLRIFGSYLNRSVDPLGDVDVELVLGRRVGDPKEALRYATASGRSLLHLYGQALVATNRGGANPAQPCGGR